MQIRSFDQNDALYTGALGVFADHEMQHGEEIPAVAKVRIREVDFLEGSVREQRTPRLALTGRCSEISFDKGDMPYNVREAKFGEDPVYQPELRFIYVFTREELAELTGKGLFDGISVPDIFIDNDFELPVDVDYKLLPPRGKDEVPVLFLQVRDRYDGIAIDTDSCGYRLCDYFEPAPEKEDVLDEYLSVPVMDEPLLFEPEQAAPVVPVVPTEQAEVVAAELSDEERWTGKKAGEIHEEVKEVFADKFVDMSSEEEAEAEAEEQAEEEEEKKKREAEPKPLPVEPEPEPKERALADGVDPDLIVVPADEFDDAF